MTAVTAISLRHARVRYGPLEALHGITLTAPGPGLTVLLGRNGSGRTTTLRALAGTVPLTDGSVVWDGTDVTRVPAYERARRGLCLVPERRSVFGSLTVRENLELAAPTHDLALDAYPQLARLLPAVPAPSPAANNACSRSPEPSWHERGWSSSTNPRKACLPRSRPARTNSWPHWTRVVVAEQRLPPALRDRTVIVYELRRGVVAFGGEAAELRPGRG